MRVRRFLDMRVLALATALFTTSVTAQCYLPDGSVADGDVPCGSALPAQCCSGACLSNGLCFNPSVNLISRSSCTDQTWNASVCTTTCKTVNPSALQVILPCGGEVFCCPPAPDSAPDSCCFNPGGTFTLQPGNVNAVDAAVNNGPPRAVTVTSTATETSIVTQSADSTPAVQVGAASASDGQSVITSISISVSISTATITLSGAQAALSAAGESTPSAASAAETSSISNESTNATSSSAVCKQKSAIVGASVGTPFAAALMAVSFLLYRARRRQQRDSIALGAQNLAQDSASVSSTASGLKGFGVRPPPVPVRPVSRLLPFSNQGPDLEPYGIRIS